MRGIVKITCKSFLWGLLAATVPTWGGEPFHATGEEAVEQAHRELVGRFLSPHGLLYDYVGELPTAKDCAECRPNAMGWWSPIENGPMFTGPWLSAVCKRARRTGDAKDRALCRKLAEGLLLAASVSDVPGMVVRGVGADGRCHYPIGSVDQTVPWFFGLHAYATSGLAEPAFRSRIVAKMLEVGRAMEKDGWNCPADGPFKGQPNGGLVKELPFRGASHYLFVLMSLCDVTGDETWLKKYRAVRDEKYPGLQLTRLEVCAQGMMIDKKDFPACDTHALWIYICAQGGLRELARFETDPAARACYRRGLAATAETAAKRLKSRCPWKNTREVPFKYANWRTGYEWREQKTQKDAREVAATGKKEVLGTRKSYERDLMSNFLAAAAICAYAGTNRAEIAETLRRYDYSVLNISEFFAAEIAWFEFDSNLPL